MASLQVCPKGLCDTRLTRSTPINMTILLACRRVLERAALAPEKLRRKLFSRSVKQECDGLSSVGSWDYHGRSPSLIIDFKANNRIDIGI
jgi:hypothetical protein